MSDEFLGDRKKALEEQFFARENEQMLAKRRASREQANKEDALGEVSGITDRDLLGQLSKLGITPETWAAIALVPLIEVAWADGTIDAKERSAVLEAAADHGLRAGSPGLELLESWLDERPHRDVLATWGETTVDLVGQLDDAGKRALADEVLGRARAVAEATGGILGLGNRVSNSEQQVLDVLAKAFR